MQTLEACELRVNCRNATGGTGPGGGGRVLQPTRQDPPRWFPVAAGVGDAAKLQTPGPGQLAAQRGAVLHPCGEVRGLWGTTKSEVSLPACPVLAHPSGGPAVECSQGSGGPLASLSQACCRHHSRLLRTRAPGRARRPSPQTPQQLHPGSASAAARPSDPHSFVRTGFHPVGGEGERSGQN